MHLRGIYEDFCVEDSFLGNRAQTRMAVLSFIRAGAFCTSSTARKAVFYFIFSLLSTASSSKGGDPWKRGMPDPLSERPGIHLGSWLSSPGPRPAGPALREKTQQQHQARGELCAGVCGAPGLGVGGGALLCLAYCSDLRMSLCRSEFIQRPPHSWWGAVRLGILCRVTHSLSCCDTSWSPLSRE